MVEDTTQLQEGNGQPTAEDYRELGASGNSQWGGFTTGEYNAKLVGRFAVDEYDRMRKSDGQVRATLNIVKAPILAAEWYVQRASDDPNDREIADFVWWALNNTSRTFAQVIRESLLCLDFGHYVYEKVFRPAEWRPPRASAHLRPVVTWKKFGPRHPRTITDWAFDAQGGIQGIRHNRGGSANFDEVSIPIKKLLIFTMDEEAGNPQGVSILRSAYKHWYFKENLYKIDAIQKERHGIGIPEVEIPPNAGKDDKRLAREMAENLRTNEKAYIVRPSNFKVGFIKVEGQTVDVLESANHHGAMITMNVLAQFLNLGAIESGSRSVSEAHQDIFIKSLRYLADLIRDVFNRYAIPQLVRYNYGNVDRYPELRVRRIGENADWRALSVTMRNLVESGVVTPDPELEAWLRNYMDFPSAPADVMDISVRDRVATRGNYSNRVEKPNE